MDLVINTGDAADSQQLNETRVGPHADGGRAAQPGQRRRPGGLRQPALRRARPADRATRRPGSTTPASRTTTTTSRARRRSSTTPTRRAARSPIGRACPDLMDRAQRPFRAAGLDVPSYITLRQPRRARAGQRGGQRRLRARGHRLRQADGAGRRRPRTRCRQRCDAARPGACSRMLATPPDRTSRWCRPTRSASSSRSSSTRRSSAPAPAGRTRVRLRRPGRGSGLGRAGGLLLVGARARHPLHLPRHRLRGGRDRPLGGWQRRPPAVPVAASASSRRRRRRTSSSSSSATTRSRA